MGFAVIAEEVLALAQCFAPAAEETANMIEDSVEKSQQGARISGDLAKSFETIQQQIRHLDALVGEIATASHEQTPGIGQVPNAVSQMDKITQANLASAEETAAASQELNTQAGLLSDAVTNLQKVVGGAVIEAETTPPAPEKISSRLAPVAAAARRRISAPTAPATTIGGSRINRLNRTPKGFLPAQDVFFKSDAESASYTL